jgi:hypothetical protein
MNINRVLPFSDGRHDPKIHAFDAIVPLNVTTHVLVAVV